MATAMATRPTKLDAFLAETDGPAPFRVDELWPGGGRILLAAQYKAGKSTMMANLMHALADDEPFLGRFTVLPAKRIVLIDDELDAVMLRQWLRDQEIRNVERVEIVSLRGHVGDFDLINPAVRAQWARAIGSADVLILDCLRPILDALGVSEATGVGKFLIAFDALLKEAKISEAAIVHHMGHDASRSRGDSRLRDWPDVEWRLTRAGTEPSAPRLFTAYGRDVDFPAAPIFYEPGGRRLSFAPPETATAPAKVDDDDMLAIIRARFRRLDRLNEERGR